MYLTGNQLVCRGFPASYSLTHPSFSAHLCTASRKLLQAPGAEQSQGLGLEFPLPQTCGQAAEALEVPLSQPRAAPGQPPAPLQGHLQKRITGLRSHCPSGLKLCPSCSEAPAHAAVSRCHGTRSHGWWGSWYQPCDMRRAHPVPPRSPSVHPLLCT